MLVSKGISKEDIMTKRKKKGTGYYWCNTLQGFNVIVSSIISNCKAKACYSHSPGQQFQVPSGFMVHPGIEFQS